MLGGWLVGRREVGQCGRQESRANVLVENNSTPGDGVDFFSIESLFSFMWAPRKTI